MVLLVSSFGFLDDQQPDSSKLNRRDCTCPPHSKASEDFNKNKNIHRYCLQISTTLDCLNRLRNSKNCSLDLLMNTLYTGTFWQFNTYNCSYVLKQGYTTIHPSITRRPKENTGRPKETSRRCIYKTKSTESLHCGLFGDPHLKTFSDKRQTCVVKGAWPMLNNKFFAVQVTNVLIDRNNPVATATSKITVLIKKSKHGCAQQRVYQANVSYVPTTFRDGTRETGPDGCITRLDGEPYINGVRLYICYVNTTILIRKVGNYLTFNIRTPEKYARQSSGLCVTGCPPSEMIDYHGFFQKHPNSVIFGSSQPAMSQKDAMKQCNAANVTDFYYDSCVFDLVSTGDDRFSNAAYRAMRDAVEMDPKLRLRRSNSVVLKLAGNELDGGEDKEVRANGCESRSRTLVLPLVALTCTVWALLYTPYT